MQYGAGTVILTGTNTNSGVTEIANTPHDRRAPTRRRHGDQHARHGAPSRTAACCCSRKAARVTFPNVIGDYNGSLTGAVTQDGPGTVTLDGVDTYTGLTEVSGGTLIIGDSATPGAKVGGNVQIDAAGTLGGYGAVMGNVVNNGVLAPSNLTIHGNLTEGGGQRPAHRRHTGRCEPRDHRRNGRPGRHGDVCLCARDLRPGHGHLPDLHGPRRNHLHDRGGVHE